MEGLEGVVEVLVEVEVEVVVVEVVVVEIVVVEDREAP